LKTLVKTDAGRGDAPDAEIFTFFLQEAEGIDANCAVGDGGAKDEPRNIASITANAQKNCRII
jgi:hypothetical protein